MSMNGGNMYPAKEGKPEIYYSVKAQRGGELRCKGWKQETILRMLENNMENAEIPEQLVIYGGNGKCARNWESYHAIVRYACCSFQNTQISSTCCYGYY